MNLENLKYPIGQFVKPIEIIDLDINNWISSIEKFPEKISKVTATLSIEALNFQYRPNGWNIKQVVHHCADSHINAYVRTKLTLTENVPTIKPYNETLWAELIDGNINSISESLMIIKGLHARWVLILKNLTPNDLEKAYFHPENNKKYQLKEVIGLYAWHCNHHLAHIDQALKFQGKF